MTKKKILLVASLISIITSVVSYGILALFYDSDDWKRLLIISSILLVFTFVSSYRYLLRAFNYDVH